MINAALEGQAYILVLQCSFTVTGCPKITVNGFLQTVVRQTLCKKVPKLYLLFVLSVCQHLGSFISIRVTERNKTKSTFSFLAVRKEIMLTWVGLALQTEHVLGCVLCFSFSAPNVAAVSTWSRCQLGANRSLQIPTVPSFIHKKIFAGKTT